MIISHLRGRLAGRQTLQKIVSNSGWLIAENILRMGGGLLIAVMMARYLGPEKFGLFNYAIAFVAIFSSLATLGLESIVVRDVVRYPASTFEILGSAFAMKIVGGGATVVLTLAAIRLVRPTDNLVIWLVGITSAGIFFQAFDTISFWFKSRYQSKYIVIARNASFLVSSGIKITLVLLSAPLITFAWAGLAEVAMGSVGLVIVYNQQGQNLRQWHVKLERAKALLNDSWPLVFTGIAISIQARIDQVMLGEMIGDHEVGQYSAAMRLIEAFGFIPMVVQSSVAPAITSAKAISEKLYYDQLLKIYRLMFILFLITALPIYLFADRIVVVFYGEEYRSAGYLLSLFAVRLFFANFGVAKSLFISNENLFRYSLLTAIIGSLVNIVLNYLLIPTYASIGAIWAMIISFFVTVFFIDIFFDQVRQNFNIMIEAILTPWKFRL